MMNQQVLNLFARISSCQSQEEKIQVLLNSVRQMGVDVDKKIFTRSDLEKAGLTLYQRSDNNG